MERKYIDRVILNRAPPAGSYLRALPAVRCLMEQNALFFPSDVTFLIGENGTGKSTLLEAIAVAAGFNAEGGSKNFSFSTHSPILMAFPGAHLYQLSERGIESVEYRRTEHYQLTKAFLDNPEKLLGFLLEE